MFEVVAPVFHKNVYGAVPPLGLTVKVCEPPAQIVALDGLTVQLGVGLTVKVAGLEVAVPQALLMQTSKTIPLSAVLTPVRVSVAVFAPEIVPPFDSGALPLSSPALQPV